MIYNNEKNVTYIYKHPVYGYIAPYYKFMNDYQLGDNQKPLDFYNHFDSDAKRFNFENLDCSKLFAHQSMKIFSEYCSIPVNNIIRQHLQRLALNNIM